MTVHEAASRLELSADTIYRLCAAGRLAHRRIGVRRGRGMIRIAESAIEDYLRSCEVTAPASATPHRTRERPRPPSLRLDGKPPRHLR